MRNKRRKIPAYEILQLIDVGYNQHQIAEKLGVSPQAINKRIKKFLKDRWIALSDAATKDARAMRFTNEKIYVLTPKGRIELWREEGLTDINALNMVINDLQKLIDKYKLIEMLKLKEEKHHGLK